MIAIIEVRMVDIDEDSMEFISHQSPTGRYTAKDLETSATTEIEVSREIIEGVDYYLPGGKILTIGLSKDVREKLGIPIEAFNNMLKKVVSYENQVRGLNNRVMKYDKKLSDAREKLTVYRYLSFWQRLKFLFTGKIKERF